MNQQDTFATESSMAATNSHITSDDDKICKDPTVLNIGHRKFDPLVSLSEIGAHLSLLMAFRDIRKTCHSFASDKEAQDKIWSIYLRRANYRFSLYVEQVLSSAILLSDRLSERKPQDLLHINPVKVQGHTHRTLFDIPEDAIPPLDVLMIWHAYMLNPGRYAEDTARVDSRRILHHVRFPLLSIGTRLKGDPTNGPLIDDAASSETRWTYMTGQDFHLAYLTPPLTTNAAINFKPPFEEGLFIECLLCARNAEMNPEARSNFESAGAILSWTELADHDWERKCDCCDATINADVLRGGIFLKDIEEWLKTSPQQMIKPFYMRGGLLSARNGRPFVKDPHAPVLCRLYPFDRKVNIEDVRMKALLAHVKRDGYEDPNLIARLNSHVPKNDQSPFSHYKEAKGSIKAWSIIINASCKSRIVLEDEEKVVDLDRRISNLLKFYLEGDPLVPNSSIDVVDAVKRQFNFINELDIIGWLDLNQYDEMDKLKSRLALSIVRYHRWLNLLERCKDLLCPTLDIDLAWHTHQLSSTYYVDCFRTVGMFVDHDDKLPATTLATAFDHTQKTWYDYYGQPYSTCGCPVRKPSGLTKFLMKLTKDKSSSGMEEVQSSSHPSAHNAVVPKDTKSAISKSIFRTMKWRKTMEQQRKTQHKDAFILGYGFTPLEPFQAVPTTESRIPGNCMIGLPETYRVGPGQCVGVITTQSIAPSGYYVGGEQKNTRYYGAGGTTNVPRMSTPTVQTSSTSGNRRRHGHGGGVSFTGGGIGASCGGGGGGGSGCGGGGGGGGGGGC
ncbi:uncharacterized protein FA14DRAFT_191770 [Meira miltonrushii]|uniref:Uncharacterized protein n=1 Tax=Meira miltonrushii TaxID=1280837 RepID=A0A316V540_9BASI|nr:uncharacterized protein FA14DRAFT_191770 [Meira miltonrushii]PWN32689.1 hypothetical protein FA14DRAFT_191770 [Meira miltonrushii]